MAYQKFLFRLSLWPIKKVHCFNKINVCNACFIVKHSIVYKSNEELKGNTINDALDNMNKHWEILQNDILFSTLVHNALLLTNILSTHRVLLVNVETNNYQIINQ